MLLCCEVAPLLSVNLKTTVMKLGVSSGTGFLFSKPLSAHDHS